jgi:hypothetical protein
MGIGYALVVPAANMDAGMRAASHDVMYTLQGRKSESWMHAACVRYGLPQSEEEQVTV